MHKRVGLSSVRGGYGAFTSTVPCKLGTGCNPYGWQGISAEFYSTVPAKPEMEYRNLGASGLKVSALSIGSWVTFGNQVWCSILKQIQLTLLKYNRLMNPLPTRSAKPHMISELVRTDTTSPSSLLTRLKISSIMLKYTLTVRLKE